MYGWIIQPTPMDIRRISLLIILVALGIASNYALSNVPNVKIMDFLVFIGGLILGPVAGILIGIITWMVYGILNPYGFMLQMYVATMFSEGIYGLAGGLLGRGSAFRTLDANSVRLSVFFGAVGFLLTLAYDLVTNVVYSWTYDMPFWAAVVMGFPFTISHELSNAALFAFGTLPVARAVGKLIRR